MRRLQQENKTNDLSANAHYPPYYPSLPTAFVPPASVYEHVVIHGKADISLKDTIKRIFNLDTDGWIRADELYERLALFFFKVKSWTKLSQAEKKICSKQGQMYDTNCIPIDRRYQQERRTEGSLPSLLWS